MNILTNEQFVATLHEGFVDAHLTCAQLGMKPMETLLGCCWTTPWERERHMEAQLYRDMREEEECDSNNLLGNAKDIDVEPRMFDEHSMTNVSTIECE